MQTTKRPKRRHTPLPDDVAKLDIDFAPGEEDGVAVITAIQLKNEQDLAVYRSLGTAKELETIVRRHSPSPSPFFPHASGKVDVEAAVAQYAKEFVLSVKPKMEIFRLIENNFFAHGGFVDGHRLWPKTPHVFVGATTKHAPICTPVASSSKYKDMTPLNSSNINEPEKIIKEISLVSELCYFLN